MKVIIAGSRGFKNYQVVCRELRLLALDITVVLSGHASGADQLGELWARAHKVPCQLFLADWSGLGRSAGLQRNRCMAQAADVLVAFWDGLSHGTAHMVRCMQAQGKPVFVVPVSPSN